MSCSAHAIHCRSFVAERPLQPSRAARPLGPILNLWSRRLRWVGPQKKEKAPISPAHWWPSGESFSPHARGASKRRTQTQFPSFGHKTESSRKHFPHCRRCCRRCRFSPHSTPRQSRRPTFWPLFSLPAQIGAHCMPADQRAGTNVTSAAGNRLRLSRLRRKTTNRRMHGPRG